MNEFQTGLFFGAVAGFFFIGFIGLAIFIGNLCRLTEWSSGGAAAREEAIRKAEKAANYWRNRFITLAEMDAGEFDEI